VGEFTKELILEFKLKDIEVIYHAALEIVTIEILNATWRLTGPNTNEGECTLAEYLAEQDINGDGFPDEGQEPAVCMGFTYTSRRLTMIPGCVPTPITE
jgi:hypothetical protein